MLKELRFKRRSSGVDTKYSPCEYLRHSFTALIDPILPGGSETILTLL